MGETDLGGKRQMVIDCIERLPGFTELRERSRLACRCLLAALQLLQAALGVRLGEACPSQSWQASGEQSFGQGEGERFALRTRALDPRSLRGFALVDGLPELGRRHVELGLEDARGQRYAVLVAPFRERRVQCAPVGQPLCPDLVLGDAAVRGVGYALPAVDDAEAAQIAGAEDSHRCGPPGVEPNSTSATWAWSCANWTRRAWPLLCRWFGAARSSASHASTKSSAASTRSSFASASVLPWPWTSSSGSQICTPDLGPGAPADQLPFATARAFHQRREVLARLAHLPPDHCSLRCE